MTDLTDLIARVEALEGPDFDLFHDVARAVCPELFRGAPGDAGRFMALLGANAWESAALALVERVLPGWRIAEMKDGIPHDGGPYCHVRLWCPVNPALGYRFPANGKTPALALILALLRALQSPTTKEREE